jgi:deoxyribodipyrimidine photo-lyase
MEKTRDNGLGAALRDDLTDPPATLLWFRRDLRLGDNPALVSAVAAARHNGGRLLPVFVWEPRERRRWSPGAAARWWLWTSLSALDEELRRRGSRLALGQGDPAQALPELARAAGAGAVVWAAGLEPDERADDAAVTIALTTAGVEAVIVPSAALLYDPLAIRTREGRPYAVFTPYWRACLDRGTPATPLPSPDSLPPPPVVPATTTLAALRAEAVRPWAAGFEEVWRPGEAGAEERLDGFLGEALSTYAEDRDRPAVEGTSRLSPHLHWGEVSGRQAWHAVAGRLAEAGLELEPAVSPAGADAAQPDGLRSSAGAFVRQLGWREFAHHILFHFPQTPEEPLQPRFAAFPWRDDPHSLEAWQRGRTGYPLVDAGLRQLWATGWMHNRARLVAASFLVKDLLLPWQVGEDWFWDTLVDADLADNALGWQWVAGCGADAAPYFRIFNPSTQSRRFDPDGAYARRWLKPATPADDAVCGEQIVEHGEARSRALAAYAAMRNAPL